MALLLDRRTFGQTSGFIAPDLADKAAAIEARQQFLVPEGSFDIRAYRRWFDEYTSILAEETQEYPLPVADRTISTAVGEVAFRTYTPRGYESVIVFAHGGGWVIGSVGTHDHICRWLAAETGSKVISVDYGLAPENPFPVAVDQTAEVIALATREREAGDHPLFIAGDSAGANIAAMAVLRASPEVQAGIAGFISIYGAYSPAMNLSSHKLYGDGRFGLSEKQMQWFWNLYAPQVAIADREILTPVSSDLSNFPPTLCIAAECDLLLDDSLSLYSSLARSGADVSLSLWPGMTHGALHFVDIVDSVTSLANAIPQYIAERRRQLGHSQTGTPTGLVRALRGGTPPRALPAKAKEPVRPNPAQPSVTLVDSTFLTSRSRLHGSVAHSLATDIIRGKVKPGSVLPNEETASASFGVSRTAYREAVRTLAAKGLVTATPKVGTRIASRSSWRLLDPDVIVWHFESNCTEPFVRSLFEMRKVVEPSAAALAAMRRSDEELARLADALARMARLDPRASGWQQAVLGFHGQLLNLADNEILGATWPAIQVTIQWSLGLQMSQPDLRLSYDPVADHAKVYDRIAAQNAEGALQEMAFLIDAALTDTLNSLPRTSLEAAS
jgi:DNA-binding FadR family transcriptional regulator/acetyl esterase/lipase